MCYGPSLQYLVHSTLADFSGNANKTSVLLVDDFTQNDFSTPLNHPKFLCLRVKLLVLRGRLCAGESDMAIVAGSLVAAHPR